MTRCTFVADDQPRMLPDGEPCHETHCIMPWCPGRHVMTGDICPVCVGETRNELAQIEAMSGRLLTEAMHQGVNSAAAALAGPAADPDVFGRRLALAIDNRLCECEPPSDDVMHPLACPFAAAYIEDAADEPHPLYVTGTWDLLVTEHLGHERTQRVTLSGAVSYLGANLTDLAADPTFPFEEMARDLRKCRSHLEDALCDGIRSETGAPCLKCKTAVIRAVSDNGAVTFRCPRCAEDLPESRYLLAVIDEYIQKSHILTTEHLVIRLGIPASTIRRWANKRTVDGVEHGPLFRSCAANERGVKMYRVADVERIRDSGGDTRGSSVPAVDGADTVSIEGAV